MRDIKQPSPNMSKAYMIPGDTIGKYFGQEALLAPLGKKHKVAGSNKMKESGMGPSPEGQSNGYSGLTSVY